MADNFIALLQKEEASIKAMLPTWISPERWWALMVEVSKSRDLQRIAQSNPTSLIAAVKKLADWGLELDGEEAIILPYGDEAVPQAMYRGLIRRAVEAGAISHAVADIIKEGDDVEIISGTDGRKLIHKPKFNMKGGKRAIIGAYALITLPNGTIDFELFEGDDIEKVKNAALRMAKRRNKDAELSPAWKMFEGEMIKKSVLRRALKRFRGKRDTEAGKRYASLSEGTIFDIETTGEQLPPDDLPAGAPTVEQMVERFKPETKPSAPPLKLTPEKPPIVVKATPAAPTTISAEEADLICARWKQCPQPLSCQCSHGHKISELGGFLLEHFEVEDATELTPEQCVEFNRLMEEAA